MQNRNDYFNFPRTRKVKHVKFFWDKSLDILENAINTFIDSNPTFKFLGVRLFQNDSLEYVATVTYLENTDGVTYGDDDGAFED